MVTIDKLSNGYVVNVNYPQATPSRSSVHESHRSMIREVLMSLGLMDAWDDLKVTVTSPADPGAHRAAVTKEL
jgi:hypothetical protein